MATEWMKTVKRVMKENPGKSLKDCMKIAKKVYHKGAKHGGGAAEVSDIVSAGQPESASELTESQAAPIGGRRRRTRKSRKTRKAKRGTRRH